MGLHAGVQMTSGHLQILCNLLAKYIPQVELWAYGSCVNGGAHEGSDLDLVLRYSSDLTKDLALILFFEGVC